MKETFKGFLSKGYIMATTAATTLMMPCSVSASNHQTDLLNTNLDANGTLNVPGAGATGNGATGAANAFNDIYDVLRVVVQGITGVMAIVMVGIFAYKAFTLSRCGDNPSERAKTIQGMIFFFIGAAAFGAASFLTGLFYNMLR